ncbi:MAG: hypothetical protein LBN05_02000 [Oscillospiraceae bacterium]|jgi:hypothetical protein|nr:hypothetical protein [Oscillospiraceae bacterium]
MAKARTGEALPAAETLTAPAVPSRASEKKWPLATLRAQRQALFSVDPVTFAGATAGLQGSYTVTELKARLAQWGKRAIKKQGGK